MKKIQGKRLPCNNVTGTILGMVTMNTNMNPILVIVTLQLQHFTVTLGVGYPRFFRIQGDVLPCIFTVCGPFCLVNGQSLQGATQPMMMNRQRKEEPLMRRRRRRGGRKLARRSFLLAHLH